MDSEFFLILHKVRGEPAFDVATKMQVDGQKEPWWIIPTSGHRAHPYWHTQLIAPPALSIEMPEGLRDHYEVKDGNEDPGILDDARAVLIRRGILKPPKPINNYRRR